MTAPLRAIAQRIRNRRERQATRRLSAIAAKVVQNRKPAGIKESVIQADIKDILIAAPSVNVTLPPSEPPSVNVSAPSVSIAPPPIPSVDVTVKAPTVTNEITLPEQPAPIVNIDAPTVPIHVTLVVPPEAIKVEVHVPPPVELPKAAPQPPKRAKITHSDGSSATVELE